jgi:hypothetical protein
MRKTIQTKQCVVCEKDIIRTSHSNLAWSLQEAHRACRPVLNKIINDEYRKLKKQKRYFTRVH